MINTFLAKSNYGIIISHVKKVLLIFIVFSFSYSVKSQDIARNTFHLELGGTAGIYSINYERLLLDSGTVNVGLRVGATYYPGIYNYDHVYGVPLSISLIKKVGKETYFEFGVFYTFLNASTYVEYKYRRGMGDTTNTPLPPTTSSWETDIYRLYGIRGGYRHHPVNKGSFWGVLIQVTISKQNDFDASWRNMTPWISFSYGYSF